MLNRLLETSKFDQDDTMGSNHIFYLDDIKNNFPKKIPVNNSHKEHAHQEDDEEVEVE